MGGNIRKIGMILLAGCLSVACYGCSSSADKEITTGQELGKEIADVEATPEPEATLTPTPIPTPTSTPEPTKEPEATLPPTLTPTPSPEPTEEPEATMTPTPMPTPEPTEEPEATMTPTPEPTEEPEATMTPTPTSTPKPTKKPEATPTPKPTKKPEVTPTPKPTKKPTPTPKPAKSEVDVMISDILEDIIEPSMNDLEKVVVIHDYMLRNIDYDYENYLAGTVPGTSSYTLGALKTGWAICGGYASTFYDLAKAAGLDVQYVSGMADNDSGKGAQGHAWNQVKIDGSWYNVDVTWDDPTWVGKEHSDQSSNAYTYFLVSDAVLEKGKHTWDTSSTYACPKSYDFFKIVKAIESTNTDPSVKFAYSKEDADEIIAQMHAQGVQSFVLYFAHSGQMQSWDVLDELFAKHNTVYSTDGASVVIPEEIYKYNIKTEEGLCSITELSEIKEVLEHYNGSPEDIRFRYYDTTITEENIDFLIEYGLAKVGCAAKRSASTTVHDNHLEFGVRLSEKPVYVVDDLSDLVDMDTDSDFELWYEGGVLSHEELSAALNQAAIPKGASFVVAGREGFHEQSVTYAEIYAKKEIWYADELQDIINAVEQYGISGVATRPIYVPENAANPELRFEISDYLYEKAEDGYALGGWRTEYGYYIGEVNREVIFDSIEQLTEEIQNAIDKNQLGYTIFYCEEAFYNSNGGEYEIIAATGCDVEIVMGYSKGGSYNYEGFKLALKAE